MQVPVPVSGSHCIRVVAVVGWRRRRRPRPADHTSGDAGPDLDVNLNIQGTTSGMGPTSPNTSTGSSDTTEWPAGCRRRARFPDLLALQEVYAFDWGDDAKPDVTDYETLFVLLDRIKARTNAEYRIAYLDTRLTEGVTMRAGNAVLYNADRLRNTTPQPGFAGAGVGRIQPDAARARQPLVQHPTREVSGAVCAHRRRRCLLDEVLHPRPRARAELQPLRAT